MTMSRYQAQRESRFRDGVRLLLGFGVSVLTPVVMLVGWLGLLGVSRPRSLLGTASLVVLAISALILTATFIRRSRWRWAAFGMWEISAAVVAVFGNATAVLIPPLLVAGGLAWALARFDPPTN
jgi:uncharacterized membrane protein YfcA